MSDEMSVDGMDDDDYASMRMADEKAAYEDARLHLAWLLWCFNEGYVNAEDRAIMTNWLLADPANLHPDDVALRPHLLAMADEVLALIREVRGR